MKKKKAKELSKKFVQNNLTSVQNTFFIMLDIIKLKV